MTQTQAPIELNYGVVQGPTALQVLIRWEKFRILYNVILAVIVIVFTALVHPGSFAFVGFWLMSIVAGIVANFCFCLGPFIDIWLFALGWFRPSTGVILFILGMIVSFGITLLATVTVNLFP